MATSNRLRGICPKILASPREIEELYSQVTKSHMEAEGVTRISLRVFLDRSMRAGLEKDGFRTEGIIPLDKQFGSAIDLVYIGKNTPDRIPQADRLKELLKLNYDNLSESRKLAAIGKSSGQYSFERITGQFIGTDLSDLLELYTSAFPIYMTNITNETLTDLLSEPTNIFLVFRFQERIVSSMIAEHTNILVEGKKLNLFELSDFATSAAHQGKHLMTHLQINAIQTILQQFGEENSVIYAENRAPNPAALRSSFYAGLSPVGALPSHVTISGIKIFDEGVYDEKGNPYETLIPAAYIQNPYQKHAAEVRSICGI